MRLQESRQIFGTLTALTILPPWIIFCFQQQLLHRIVPIIYETCQPRLQFPNSFP